MSDVPEKKNRMVPKKRNRKWNNKTQPLTEKELENGKLRILERFKKKMNTRKGQQSQRMSSKNRTNCCETISSRKETMKERQDTGKGQERRTKEVDDMNREH